MFNLPIPSLPIPNIDPTITLGVPVGTVVAFAGEVTPQNLSENKVWPNSPNGASSLPKASDAAPVIPIEQMGWMLCDGRELLISEYPELFAVIGYLYGKGDEGKFIIPDYRGLFLRGTNGASGMDPDVSSRVSPKRGQGTKDGVGSLQYDALQTHKHQYNKVPQKQGQQTVLASGQGQPEFVSIDLTEEPISEMPPQENTVRTGVETRPKNVSVNYIIKYTKG